MVGEVEDVAGCLTVRDTRGREWMPAFAPNVDAVERLVDGDIVMLQGRNAVPSRPVGWEPREDTIRRLGVAVPDNCPDDMLFFIVITEETDPLVPGEPDDDAGLRYAWRDPFVFGWFPQGGIGDTDRLPGRVVDRDGCLVVTDTPGPMGDVLPLFNAATVSARDLRPGDDVWLPGWLAKIEGDLVRLVHIRPRAGEVHLTPSNTIIGRTAGMRIPESCPETQYVWVDGSLAHIVHERR